MARICYVLGLAFGKEGRLTRLEGGETVKIFEAIMIALTFGIFIVSLIGIVVVIIQLVIK